MSSPLFPSLPYTFSADSLISPTYDGAALLQQTQEPSNTPATVKCAECNELVDQKLGSFSGTRSFLCATCEYKRSGKYSEQSAAVRANTDSISVPDVSETIRVIQAVAPADSETSQEQREAAQAALSTPAPAESVPRPHGVPNQYEEAAIKILGNSLAATKEGAPESAADLVSAAYSAQSSLLLSALASPHPIHATQDAGSAKFPELLTPPSPPITCPKCNKVCKSRSSLNTHITRKHAESKVENACPHCNKVYLIKDSLTKHIARKHLGSKNYPCTVLAKERQDHIARHEKGRKFICEYPGCPQGYSTKNSLNLHISRVHKEPRFACPLCPEKYAVKGDLNQHLRRKHSGGTQAKSSRGSSKTAEVPVLPADGKEYIPLGEFEMTPGIQMMHPEGMPYSFTVPAAMPMQDPHIQQLVQYHLQAAQSHAQIPTDALMGSSVLQKRPLEEYHSEDMAKKQRGDGEETELFRSE